MNIKQLKEAIKDLPNETLVYVYADHGQMCMKSATTEEITIRPEDLGKYHIEDFPEVYEDDLPAEWPKIFEISSP